VRKPACGGQRGYGKEKRNAAEKKTHGLSAVSSRKNRIEQAPSYAGAVLLQQEAFLRFFSIRCVFRRNELFFAVNNMCSVTDEV
jgi:hypothetical protein